MEKEIRKCPYCGGTEHQYSIGKTKAGSKRFRCKACRRDYTPEPKKWAYTEAEKKEALRLLLLGNSGRAVGKALKMHRSNAYRWAAEAQKRGLPPVDKS
jgi:transposase-like protein